MSNLVYRRFGRTGLDMPVFSCGGMRYQHSWKDVPLEEIPGDNQRNLEATIRRAVELGLNHIETARGYGSSEAQLGRILPAFPREHLIVQTKVGPRDTGSEFRAVVEKSLGLLHLDHVDLLALHGINNEEVFQQAMRPGGSLEAALALKREGRCRWVGFSTHAPPSVIVKTIETGAFDYVNLHWYWVNTFAGPALEAARRHDLGVFIISPNDKGGKLYEPSEKLKALCAPLTPMQFNDLYCLARPDIHTLSIGAARPTDFDEHLDALRHFDANTALSLQAAGRLEAEMVRVLGADWCAHWHENLPAWNELPGNVNVFEILRLWNFAKALDMVAFARMRYNLLGQGEHWFPGQPAVDVSAEKMKSALEGYRFADRVPEILAEAHAWFSEAPRQRLSSE